MTEESKRLSSIYDQMNRDHLDHSLTLLMGMSNDSEYVASVKSMEVLHKQGKQRKIGMSRGLLASYEYYEVNQQVDELVEEKILEIINDYLAAVDQTKKRSYNKVCALIILLFGKGLFGLIDKLNFDPKFDVMIKDAYDSVITKKDYFTDELVEHFQSRKMYLHAERTKKIGYQIFEIRSDFSRRKYLSDLVEEDFKDEDYQKMLEIRKRFLSETYSLNFKDLGKIIGPLPERTWSDNRKKLIKELESKVNQQSITYLNKLIL